MSGTESEESSKRFKIINQNDINKWNLPEDMAMYANKHFTDFISDKDVNEAVLQENPAPNNIEKVKNLMIIWLIWLIW